MHRARLLVLGILLLVLVGVGLVACGSYGNPGNGGGTPAPTATNGGY